MADNAKTLEVTILGRAYRVACEPAERDALLKAVAFVDSRMAEIKKLGKNATTERIAVMAALNIAHEFLTQRAGGGVDVGEAKRRIASIEAQLDEAIARQEKLF
jgi:cell division protein ZapA